MKARILFFSALVMTLGLFSCSKDDKDDDGDGGKTQSELVLGTWNVYEAYYVGYANGQKVEEDTEELDFTLEVKDDNTFVITQDGESETGTYTMSNGKFIIDFADSDTPEEMQIVKLDANNFHFKGVYNEEYEGVTYRYEETYKANK